MVGECGSGQRKPDRKQSLWRCGGGVMKGVRGLIELLHWEFMGDIGQLCIGNWFSVVLQNTEQLMFTC